MCDALSQTAAVVGAGCPVCAWAVGVKTPMHRPTHHAVVLAMSVVDEQEAMGMRMSVGSGLNYRNKTTEFDEKQTVIRVITEIGGR